MRSLERRLVRLEAERRDAALCLVLLVTEEGPDAAQAAEIAAAESRGWDVELIWLVPGRANPQAGSEAHGRCDAGT